MEKEIANHSSTITWKIQWTEELGRLQSMGPQRVGHDWVINTSGSVVKNLPANAGEMGLIPESGKSPEKEEEMETHFSVLAWKISWTEEAGGLRSTGSQRVEHDWVTNTYLLTYLSKYSWSSSSWSDVVSIIAAFNLTTHYANMFYKSWGALRSVWATSQSKDSLKDSIARCAMIPRIVDQEKRKEMGTMPNKEQQRK